MWVKHMLNVPSFVTHGIFCIKMHFHTQSMTKLVTHSLAAPVNKPTSGTNIHSGSLLIKQLLVNDRQQVNKIVSHANESNPVNCNDANAEMEQQGAQSLRDQDSSEERGRWGGGGIE